MASIFEPSVSALSKSLDLYLLRQAVTADNIANAETPQFKARRVEFEEELKTAIDLGGTSHGSATEAIENVGPRIVEDPQSEIGQDLNTVDMDREMAVMTKNDIRYSATSLAVSKKFGLLKFAISGGGER